MVGSAVTDSRSPPPCAAMSSGSDRLTIPEILAVAGRSFLKSDFALVEDALRKREDALRHEVASALRRELSQKEAENAELRAKCDKACTTLAAMPGELRKLLAQQEAERQDWRGKEEVYKRKVAELEGPRGADARLHAQRRAWEEQAAGYGMRIAKLEAEVRSVSQVVEAERGAWREKEEGYVKKIATLEKREHYTDGDALLQPERRSWREKEESYNRWIAKLEHELKSDALGRKEAETLHMQAKSELMKMIEMLRDSEEVVVKLQKEFEEHRDLKLKYEQLLEDLKEGKRNEEVYEERISELEKELKDREEANTKFLEVTSACLELEEEKEAAEAKAQEWKRKYEELQEQMSRAPPAVHTSSSKSQIVSLRPCRAGLPAEASAPEKPSWGVSTMYPGVKMECRTTPVREDVRKSEGGVIEISDSEDEGESVKRCKRLHK